LAEIHKHRLGESLQRFSEILSESEIQQTKTIQDQPLYTGIRINPLKANPKSAIHDLAARYSWNIETIPFSDNAWLIKSAEFPPGKTIEHRLGVYYLQDAASMVPVNLMEFDQPHPLILDMAASPGGKTTHLVDRTQDQGFILANDASQGRIPALRSVLASWGGINLAVTSFPGENFGSWFPETFDRILLDAPCSMENLRPSPTHPLRETTQDERLRLQDRQVKLLISGLQALKIGGQLVYATCSLAPEEDEAVINQVLDAFPHAISIENVSAKLPFKAPGLTSFKSETFTPALVNTLRLWPHITGMSGFYCGRLKKNEPIPSSNEPPPSREFSRTHLVPASQALQHQIYQMISDNYGFDIEILIKHYQLKLFTRYEGVYLIPEAYLENFNQLPFEFIGMLMGLWRAESFQPSIEFISRFGGDFSTGIIHIDDDQVPTWIAGRDIRNPQTDLKASGQYLLVVDSSRRNLGMGKLLPKRLRNMLPKMSV